MSFKNLANDHNGLYKAHKSATKETTWAFTSKLNTDEKMRKGNRREWDVMWWWSLSENHCFYAQMGGDSACWQKKKNQISGTRGHRVQYFRIFDRTLIRCPRDRACSLLFFMAMPPQYTGIQILDACLEARKFEQTSERMDTWPSRCRIWPDWSNF